MTVLSTQSTGFSKIIAADRAAWQAAKNAGPKSIACSSDPDVTVTFSAEAMELMRRREVSDDSAQLFADIMAKAESNNAMANPKGFLNTLTGSEMEVLRQVHCLADTINIRNLSMEGAANLLTQPGSGQDLNNDGLTTTGAANSFTFPPNNAPASFKSAWKSATEGMSPLEIPTHMIFAVGLANLGLEPGDPNWHNPYADPDYDYLGEVNRIMEGLDYALNMGWMSMDRYQHDMGFYQRLTEAMGPGNG